MNYESLTDAQLKKLARLRLENERACVTVTRLRIEERKTGTDKIFLAAFVVNTKEWKPYRFIIMFTKFFPNEFLYMQKCGIEF